MVTVTVVEDDGGQSSDSFQVVVNNVAPAVDAGPDQTVNGVVSLPPATFHDPGLADTHTAIIDWGDGVVEAGNILQWRGSATVAGSHTYAAAGVYTVRVSVTDDDGDSGSDSMTVTAVVQNQAPTVQQEPTTFLLGQAQTHAFALMDPNPDDTHAATIAWGDGSAVEVVPLANNLHGFGAGFPVHTYTLPGVYDITVTVTDDRGLTGLETITVMIARGSSNDPPMLNEFVRHHAGPKSSSSSNSAAMRTPTMATSQRSSSTVRASMPASSNR